MNAVTQAVVSSAYLCIIFTLIGLRTSVEHIMYALTFIVDSIRFLVGEFLSH